MYYNSLIEQITIDFINAWNCHDMDKLATYLSNDIIVFSPNIQRLFPDNTDSKLHKKVAVMHYWSTLNEHHFFNMQLIVLSKSNKIIHCKIDIGQQEVNLYATFTMDEYCKFTHMTIEYRP